RSSMVSKSTHVMVNSTSGFTSMAPSAKDATSMSISSFTPSKPDSLKYSKLITYYPHRICRRRSRCHRLTGDAPHRWRPGQQSARHQYCLKSCAPNAAQNLSYGQINLRDITGDHDLGSKAKTG